MDIVFITDLHITANSNVRTGNVLDDVLAKLNYVVDYCNKNNCSLLLGGDIFDKPTVPDFVKARVVEVLRKSKNLIYSIMGNHDRVYNNPEFNFKTSYNLLRSVGIFTDLDSVEGIDFGDFYLTSQVPVITRNKPQLVVFHGFLNQEDGRNTFRFTDIQSSDKLCICLGHLHEELEPLSYGNSIIFRTGSFLRTTRNLENMRTPKMLKISITSSGFNTSLIEIPVARDCEEIFKTKECKITSTEKHLSYASVIEQIRDSKSKDMTFQEAVNQVADTAIAEYIFRVLEESKIESINKKL